MMEELWIRNGEIREEDKNDMKDISRYEELGIQVA